MRGFIFLKMFEGNTKRWLTCTVLAIIAIRLFTETITTATTRYFNIPFPWILGVLLIWSIILITPAFKPEGF